MLREAREYIAIALGRPRRWRFLQRLPQGGIGAEIGVFRGELSTHLLRVAKPRELHLIDGWWTLYGETYPDWGAYTDFGALSTRAAFDEARRAAPAANFHVGDDLEILPTFPDGYFDWVYLDTSHIYEHTLEELTILDRKVSGIIMGDDWIPDPTHVNHGVCRAVSEWCSRTEWKLLEIDPFGQWAIRKFAPKG